MSSYPNLRSRYLGAMLGLACGDAVGTSVEFSPRGSFAPVTDMVGGGPFALQPGQWTDDTSMALCLAESLLTKGAFDAADQMTRYHNWWHWGYLSSTGDCFDIGMTVRAALARFAATGAPFSGATDPRSAGNGSLMRLAPVVLFAYPDLGTALHLAGESSRTTHGAPEAIECCKLFAVLLLRALAGTPRAEMLRAMPPVFAEARIAAIASGAFRQKTEGQVRGSGYCVESLEAALWCFWNTDRFEEAVLRAVNLGEDADTTGAIVGQLAGAYYGHEAIPATWLERLAMRDDIGSMAQALHDRVATHEL
jgi:ADP-ribosyl-[dinitrogen reductase] hydrolase